MAGIITLPRTTRRHLALGTSMVFVGALLLAQAHRVIVRHAYCSDHGELIHLQQAAGELPKMVGTSQTRLHTENKVEGIHGCLALTFITTPSLQPRTSESGAMSRPQGEQPPGLVSVLPTIQQLRQAPKQSPPRA